MNFFTSGSVYLLIAVVVTSVAAASNTNHRRSGSDSSGLRHHHRRYLMPADISTSNTRSSSAASAATSSPTTECVLYLKDIEWEDPGQQSDESWSCEFTNQRVVVHTVYDADEDDDDNDASDTDEGSNSHSNSNSKSNTNNPTTTTTTMGTGIETMTMIMDIIGIPKEVIDSYAPISGGSILKITTSSSASTVSSSASATSASSAEEEGVSASSASAVAEEGAFIEQSLDQNGNPFGEMKLIMPQNVNFRIKNLVESDSRHYKSRRRRRKQRQRQLMEQHDDDDNQDSATSGKRNLGGSPAGKETLEVLVVRVTAGGSQPTGSIQEIYNDIFDDPVCLKSQYAACSKEQVTIVPSPNFNSYRNNGIVSITVTGDGGITNDPGTLEQQASNKLRQLYGSKYEEDIDLLMMCFPEGTGYVSSVLCYIYIYIYLYCLCCRCQCRIRSSTRLTHSLPLSI